jgi:putative sigma-54 modulation protein
MNIAVSYRHMDASPAIQRYATEKLQHIVSKYIHGQRVDGQVTFAVEKIWHIANFTLSINGLTLKAVVKTHDMHEAIDLALQKVESQVKRWKDRIRAHKPDVRTRSLSQQILDNVESPEAEQGEVAPTTTAQPPAPAQSVAAEAVTAPFLTPEQAIMQLELLHAPFFLFTNEQTERINIVFPREDGRYGLIEAQPSHH